MSTNEVSTDEMTAVYTDKLSNNKPSVTSVTTETSSSQIPITEAIVTVEIGTTENDTVSTTHTQTVRGPESFTSTVSSSSTTFMTVFTHICNDVNNPKGKLLKSRVSID